MPTSADAERAHATQRISTLLAHATFIPTGAVTVMLGPLLPMLSARWNLSDTRAGYLITAQFAGALVSTVSTSAIVPRWGFRRTIAAGQILMAIGAASLVMGSFSTGILSVVCYGAGIGFTIPTVNLMIAAAETEHRSSALNVLNFSWSAGAVACPLVLASLKEAAVPAFLRSLALLLVILAILVVLFGPGGSEREDEDRKHKLAPWLQYCGRPAVIVLGMIFFLYVGTENAVSAWLASYAKRASSTTTSGWIAVPSYFYAALLLGRALAPLSLRRWNDYQQARLGLLLAAASISGLLLSRSVAEIAACAFFAGLGFSTLYPIAIGFVGALGPAAPRIGGFMFALSTLGGASVPWLVGFTSTQLSSLRTALVIPLIGCGAMLFLYASRQVMPENLETVCN